jgi:conjugative transfer signal peptidase TraF
MARRVVSDDQHRRLLALGAAAKLMHADPQKPATARRYAAPHVSGARAANKGHVPITVLVLAALGLTFAHATRPLLILNTSPSVAIGIYWLDPRRPLAGDLAAITLPEPVLTLADARGYLPAGALLIKRLATHTGDVVCRFASTVTINGQLVAVAQTTDRSRRAMPRWSGCSRVAAGQMFVLSDVPSSFDSRYFGKIARRQVLGTALPIWQGGG